MTPFDRRALLRTTAQATLAVGAVGGLSACSSGSGSQSGPAGESGALQWWMGSQPDIEMNKKLVKQHQAELGEVKIRYIKNAQYGQALQLAKQSNQLPDIAVNGGLGLPLPQLIENGWFQPLELSDEANERLKDFPLFEGKQKFDGKLYTFPIRDSFYSTIPWYQTDPMEKAGLDPKEPPTTYDEFRNFCKAVKKTFGGRPAALLLALKGAGRNGGQADDLAQAAGFQGADGQDFRTGEYNYQADEYINAIEFQKSLVQDGYTAGGVTLAVKDGQAHWASGESVCFWDGPWIPGNVYRSYQKLKGHYWVGKLLVPNANDDLNVYVGPPGGMYFIPKGAKKVKQANALLSLLTTPEYLADYVKVTGDPPPVDSVMDQVKTDDVVTQNLKNLHDSTYVAPDPIIGKPELWKVAAAIKPVKPDFGTIIQGYFSGDVKDLKKALTKLSSDSSKALDNAIKAAAGKGVKATRDDYAFPNWQPKADYTQANYDAR